MERQPTTHLPQADVTTVTAGVEVKRSVEHWGLLDSCVTMGEGTDAQDVETATDQPTGTTWPRHIPDYWAVANCHK